MDKKTRGRNPTKTKSPRATKSKSADSNKKKTKKQVVSKRSKSNPGKLKIKSLKGNNVKTQLSRNSLPNQTTEKLKCNLENIRHSSLRFNLNNSECKNTPPTYSELKKEIRANKAYILTSPNSLEALQEEVNAYRKNLNSHVNYLHEKFGIQGFTNSGIFRSKDFTEQDATNEEDKLHFRSYKPTDKSDKYCTDALDMSYDPLRSDVDAYDEYDRSARENISDEYLKTISERTEAETKSDVSDVVKGSSRGTENVPRSKESRSTPKVQVIQLPCSNTLCKDSSSGTIPRLPSPKSVQKVHCDTNNCQSEIEHKCVQCSTFTLPAVEKCISCKIPPDCDKNINTEFIPNPEMPKNTAVVATVSKLKNNQNTPEKNLTIQHMPSIQIQRELVMQKVLNLNINPTVKPEDCQLPLTNVSYLECSHDANFEKKVACTNNCIRESLTRNLNHIEEVRKHAGRAKKNVLSRIDTIAASIREDLNILNTKIEEPTKEQVLVYKCIDDLSNKKLCVKGVDESQRLGIKGLDKNSIIGDDEVVKDEPQREKDIFGNSFTQDVQNETHCVCEGNPNRGKFPSAWYVADGLTCNCEDSFNYKLSTHGGAAMRNDHNKDVNITFVTEIISENCENKKSKNMISKSDEEDLILVHDVSVQVSLEDIDYMNEEYIKSYIRNSIDQSKIPNFDEYGKTFSDLNVSIRSKSLKSKHDLKISLNTDSEFKGFEKHDTDQTFSPKILALDVNEIGSNISEKRRTSEESKYDKKFSEELNIIDIDPDQVKNSVQIERIMAPKSIKSSKSNLDQFSEEFAPKNSPTGDTSDLKPYYKPCHDKTCSKKKISKRHRKPTTIPEIAKPTINALSTIKDESFSEGEVKNKHDTSTGELDTKIQTILAPTTRNLAPKESIINGKHNIYNKNFVSYYYAKSSSQGSNNSNGVRIHYNSNK